ncbi:PaaI family thioesterase [Streptomyces griseoviridis]|uniref:PaaI family thioesterase n=1 Tax=Streptomyces griseoviridis TaxID=45398 RepID=UPI00345F76C1
MRGAQHPAAGRRLHHPRTEGELHPRRRHRGPDLTADGSVIHLGRSTATAEGRVHDENGKLIAHATTTCLILRPQADGPRG